MESRGGNRMLSILASKTLRCFSYCQKRQEEIEVPTWQHLKSCRTGWMSISCRMSTCQVLYGRTPFCYSWVRKATAHWWDRTVVCPTSVISAIISQHPTYVSPWKSVFIDLQPKSAEKLEHTQGNTWELYNPPNIFHSRATSAVWSRVGGEKTRVKTTWQNSCSIH